MTDVNKPLENPSLVAALNAYHLAPTQENESALEHELQTAHFLAPVKIAPSVSPESGTAVLEQNTTLSFYLLYSSDEKYYFPAFTDWRELNKWSDEPGRETFIVTLGDYSAMLRQDERCSGVAINPYGQNFVLSPQALSWVNGEAVPITAEKGSSITVGDPAQPVDDIVEAACAYFRSTRCVKQAFIRQIVRDETPSLLIVVDFNHANERELFNGIAFSVRKLLNGRYLDLISYSDDFGRAATRNCEPFYTK